VQNAEGEIARVESAWISIVDHDGNGRPTRTDAVTSALEPAEVAGFLANRTFEGVFVDDARYGVARVERAWVTVVRVLGRPRHAD
jgi:hypothetical protein